MSIGVPLALKILAVPEPLKEFRVVNVTPEVPRINAESSPVVESKTKFFTLNV